MATAAGFASALEPDELAALEALGRPRRYRPGAPIFHQDTSSDGVVLITGGRVKVSTATEEGREVVLAFRGPGDLLGELSAIDGRPRSATVSALEPVDVLIVRSGDFRAFLEAHPRVSVLLLEMLSRRLRDADRKRIEYAAHDTVGRVSARLVELAEGHGEATGTEVEITLPLSQEELAGWTGASREATAKALHTLRRAGWVRTERRRITVLDIESLRRRSM